MRAKLDFGPLPIRLKSVLEGVRISDGVDVGNVCHNTPDQLSGHPGGALVLIVPSESTSNSTLSVLLGRVPHHQDSGPSALYSQG
jgi:hypothetical protein